MEGEANFLTLMPLKSRKPVVDFWYRGASDDVKNYLFGDHFDYALETAVTYKTDKPQQELYGLLRERIGENLSQHFSLQQVSDKKLRKQIGRLQQTQGVGLSVLPEASILRVDDATGKRIYFTLLHNKSYSNISQLLNGNERRRPAEDNLTVVPGIIGAYPNAFFKTTTVTLGEFVDQFASLQSEADYDALLDNFGIRRTNPDFWAFSDALQRDYLQIEPVTGAILDYNRFENR
jgi:hypothetical protein